MPHSAVVAGRKRPRLTYAYVLGLVFAGLATGQATAATAPTGGAQAGSPPKLRALICRTACAGVSVARAGSRVRVKGRALKAVDSVVFQGAAGGADDVSVPALRPHKKWVDARVPRTAVSGPVVLVSVDGSESAPSPVPLTIDPAAPAATGGTGDTLGIDVEVQGNRVFYGAERMAQVSYLVQGTQPANVAVELIRISDGVAITRWEPGLVQAGTPQTITWDGTAGGKVQRDGRYFFRVFATSASGATASSAGAPTVPAASPPTAPAPAASSSSATASRSAAPTTTGPAPLRSAAAAATRARTPSPSAAPRSSRPAAASSSSSSTTRPRGTTSSSTATNEGYDYAYMHLRDASLVDEGDHVYTGQPIGFVGNTGRASGCHLHFEVWKAPGWYSGGSAINPLPLLQAWDKT